MSAERGIFAGLSFLILGKDLDWPLEQVKGAIRANGGWFTAGEGPFTHVILSSSLWTNPGKEADDTWLMAIAYQNAETRRGDDEDHGRIWLMPVEWLEESIIEQRRLPEREYDVQRVVEEEDRQYEERQLEYFLNQQPAARPRDPTPEPEQVPEPEVAAQLVDVGPDEQAEVSPAGSEAEEPLPTAGAKGEKLQADLDALLAQFDMVDLVEDENESPSGNGDARGEAGGTDEAELRAEAEPRAEETVLRANAEKRDSDGDVERGPPLLQDVEEGAAQPSMLKAGDDAEPPASTPKDEQRDYAPHRFGPALDAEELHDDLAPHQVPTSSTPKREEPDLPILKKLSLGEAESDADEGPLPLRKAQHRKAPRILDSDSDADPDLKPRDHAAHVSPRRAAASAAIARAEAAHSEEAKVAPRPVSLATPPRQRLVKPRDAPDTPDTSDSSEEEDRPPQIFDGLVFYVHGEWAGWTRGKVKRVIEEHGGTISGQLTNACISHLITSEARWLTHAVNNTDLTIRAFQTANKKNRKDDDEDHHRVWILPLEWVEESTAAGKCLPERGHDLERTHEAKEQKRAAEHAADGRANGGKIRPGRGSRIKVDQKRAHMAAQDVQPQTVKSEHALLLGDVHRRAAAQPPLDVAPASFAPSDARSKALSGGEGNSEDDLAPLDIDKLLRKHSVDRRNLAAGLHDLSIDA